MHKMPSGVKLDVVKFNAKPNMLFTLFQFALHNALVSLCPTNFLQRRKGCARRRSNHECGPRRQHQLPHARLHFRVTEIKRCTRRGVFSCQIDAPSRLQTHTTVHPDCCLVANSWLRINLHYVRPMPLKSRKPDFFAWNIRCRLSITLAPSASCVILPSVPCLSVPVWSISRCLPE